MNNETLAVDPAVGMDNGDTFDETTGSSLGSLDFETIPLSFPVEISVYQNGCWYVYKLDRKYEDGKEGE